MPIGAVASKVAPVAGAAEQRGSGGPGAVVVPENPPWHGALQTALDQLESELIEFRRDLHAHPEPGWAERRTTERIARRLAEAGLEPHLLHGTGLTCDIIATNDDDDDGASPSDAVPRFIGVRADVDALPLPDTCGRAWESQTDGWAHGCGHDVHAAAALGAALALAELAAQGWPVPPTRFIFQPAEEVTPSGAPAAMRQHVLDGVAEIVAVHCEPKLPVGLIGTRVGPITSATDQVAVRLTGSGGHTSRPHLTGDVVFALGEVITQVPAILGRRLDPRSGVNLTWGQVAAGETHNAIPAVGRLAGTLRCLDAGAWERAGAILDEAIRAVASPFGVGVELEHVRGIPPVENDPHVTAALEHAAVSVVGRSHVVPTEQSLGGEDFAWYLTQVPGSMARLGTGRPGAAPQDLHQGGLDIDESAIRIGAALFATFVMDAPSLRA